MFFANLFAFVAATAGPVELPDAETGKAVRLVGDKGTVLIFHGRNCDFCKAYRDRFRKLGAAAAGKGMRVFGIDPTADRADAASVAWNAARMGFPLLMDADGKAAAGWGAETLTTVCILDAQGVVRYLGSLDDDETGRRVTANWARDALDDLAAGRPVRTPRTDAFGCPIDIRE